MPTSRDQIIREFVTERLSVVQDNGSEILCRCPFHKEGRERHPSFSVNVHKGVFGCFTCHKQGVFRTLVKELESSDYLSKEIIGRYYAAPESLADVQRTQPKGLLALPTEYPHVPETFMAYYNYAPKKLIDAGFNVDVMKKMGVGYDPERNTILFPVRRQADKKINSVHARSLDPNASGKYYVYNEEIRKFAPDYCDALSAKIINPRDHLWGEHFLDFNAPPPYSILVEGFKAALWVRQAGYDNVLAIMGNNMTPSQIGTVSRLSRNVVLMLDNNEAGRLGTQKAISKLWGLCPSVVVAQYPDRREQPDDLTQQEVWAAILTAKPPY